MREDGEKIQVTFDQPLIAIGLAAHEHFQIAFKVPSYVPEGVLEDVTRIPYAVQNAPAIHAAIDLSNGTMSGLVFSDGMLHLAEATEEV